MSSGEGARPQGVDGRPWRAWGRGQHDGAGRALDHTTVGSRSQASTTEPRELNGQLWHAPVSPAPLSVAVLVRAMTM